MRTIGEFTNHLKSILKLLQEEKQALLTNDANKVEEIVERKTDLIEKLAQFKGLDIEKSNKVMKMIEEIHSLQEINLLMTKQALSFQQVLLESIAKNVQNMSQTYSAKGSYQASSPISLVDQSV